MNKNGKIGRLDYTDLLNGGLLSHLKCFGRLRLSTLDIGKYFDLKRLYEPTP